MGILKKDFESSSSFVSEKQQQSAEAVVKQSKFHAVAYPHQIKDRNLAQKIQSPRRNPDFTIRSESKLERIVVREERELTLNNFKPREEIQRAKNHSRTMTLNPTMVGPTRGGPLRNPDYTIRTDMDTFRTNLSQSDSRNNVPRNRNKRA